MNDRMDYTSSEEEGNSDVDSNHQAAFYCFWLSREHVIYRKWYSISQADNGREIHEDGYV